MLNFSFRNKSINFLEYKQYLSLIDKTKIFSCFLEIYRQEKLRFVLKYTFLKYKQRKKENEKYYYQQMESLHFCIVYV